jgi:hypothetical protein
LTSFDDERKLLMLRKVQIESELENLNVRIKDLTKKSDELYNNIKVKNE